MQAFLAKIGVPIARKDGEALAELFEPNPQYNPALKALINGVGNCDRSALEVYKGSIIAPWDEVNIALIQVATNMMDNNYGEAYREQAHLVNQFFRFFITQTAWVLPTLHKLLKTLRQLAAKADLEAREKGEKTDALEDAARICNKAFTNCLTDRTPLIVNGRRNSRKWGTYRAVGVTLKSYIKADKMGLHKSLLRSLTVQTDMPTFDLFPKADQITCKYYFGLLAFLSEDWNLAYDELSFAFTNCQRRHMRNQELILTYLIPLQLMRGRLPSQTLLTAFPRLEELYTPFIRAIKQGNVQAFDAALTWAEPRLIQQNVWIAIEKAREVCLRGLYKKMWVALGAKTRLPVGHIKIALGLAGAAELSSISASESMDHESNDKSGKEKEEAERRAAEEQEEAKERENDLLDEAECITAGMIFRGFVRGYISHEKRMVVLAAKDPFPSLATVAVRKT